MPPKPTGKSGKAAPAASHGNHFVIATRVIPPVVAPAHPTQLQSFFHATPSFYVISRSSVSVEAKPTFHIKHQATFRFVTAGNAPFYELTDEATVLDAQSKENVQPLKGSADAQPLTACAVGTNHYALVTKGGLYVGGTNDFGQLGTPRDVSAKPQPLQQVVVPRMDTKSKHVSSTVALAPPPTILDVACGSKHTLIVVMRTRDDAYFDDPKNADRFVSYTEVLGCGYVRKYALGDLNLEGSSIADVSFTGIDKLKTESIDAVWAGGDMSFARGMRGLFAFGTCSSLEFGKVEITEPTLIAPVDSGRIIDVSFENSRIFALTAHNRVLQFTKSSQVVGFTDVTDALFKSLFASSSTLPTIRRLSSGKEHSVALLNDGNVLGWGQNAFGQLGSNGYVQNPLSAVLVHNSSADLKPEIVDNLIGDAAEKESVSTSVSTSKHPPTIEDGAAVAAWPSQTVANVCCSPWATLILTFDGQVSVIGRNSYGNVEPTN